MGPDDEAGRISLSFPFGGELEPVDEKDYDVSKPIY